MDTTENILEFEELTHVNFKYAAMIQREDVCEAFADTAATVMAMTDYGIAHHCIGHSFLVKYGRAYIGLILLGEALHWETDPPEMQSRPFYRLMGFVVDKRFRGRGLGTTILEETVRRVYADFGERPIALGCHRNNAAAAAFYRKNGFTATRYLAGDDVYYLRY